MENLNTATPVEIDTEIAKVVTRANVEYAKANNAMAAARKREKWGGAYAKSAPGLRDQAAKHRAAGDAIRAEAAPLDAEYTRRGGWSRAYLVPAGHVHRSTACSALHIGTLVSWLPELSGLDEDGMVAKMDHVACTKCFPSAPVIDKATAAKADPDACPGSGSHQADPAKVSRNRRYATCDTCGETVGRNTYGSLRKHKSAAARERAAEAAKVARREAQKASRKRAAEYRARRAGGAA